MIGDAGDFSRWSVSEAEALAKGATDRGELAVRRVIAGEGDVVPITDGGNFSRPRRGIERAEDPFSAIGEGEGENVSIKAAGAEHAITGVAAIGLQGEDIGAPATVENFDMAGIDPRDADVVAEGPAWSEG